MSMYNGKARLKQPDSSKDGRTKQAYKNDCDINLIMARAAQGGTISHLARYEGIYADFSDFNFHEHLTQLNKGREVFDDLPAEIRREFGQSPEAFFAYVNDPKNINDLAQKLPGLAKPGTQLPRTTPLNADEEKRAAEIGAALPAALAAASELASENKSQAGATTEATPASAGESE